MGLADNLARAAAAKKPAAKPAAKPITSNQSKVQAAMAADKKAISKPAPTKTPAKVSNPKPISSTQSKVQSAMAADKKETSKIIDNKLASNLIPGSKTTTGVPASLQKPKPPTQSLKVPPATSKTPSYDRGISNATIVPVKATTKSPPSTATKPPTVKPPPVVDPPPPVVTEPTPAPAPAPATPKTILPTPDTSSPGGGNLDPVITPPPVKSAPIDTVIFVDEAIPNELIVDLLFEDVGGQELLSIARNDTVNGQDVVYQPFKNLDILQATYNPNTILRLPENINGAFANFTIDLRSKIPTVGNGKNGVNYYVDMDTADIILEFVNLKTDEQVELEISDSAIIEELGI